MKIKKLVKPKNCFLSLKQQALEYQMKVILLTIKYRTGTGSTITNIWVLKLTHKILKIFHALGFQNTISLTPPPPFIMLFWNVNVFNLVLQTLIKTQWIQKSHIQLDFKALSFLHLILDLVNQLLSTCAINYTKINTYMFRKRVA